ncbi:MAG: response regulator [Melioribacteraceae bacterium]|nr:response regulator [Melioribacteraceae bacterium]
MKEKQLKILIVDDEQVVVDSLEKICALEDFQTSFALTAEDGLSLLSKDKFDLILSDIMLPEMNGFEFLETLHLRKIETPVIMITGYSTLENAVKALNEGAIDYIPKPFEVDEILSALYRAKNFIRIRYKVKEEETTDIVYVNCPSKYFRLGLFSWVHITDEGSALVGATDLFLKTIDNYNNLTLKEIEEEIYQGSSCAKLIEDDVYIHDLLAPISGKIIERNEAVINNNSIIEKDPFFNGWLYRVIPTDIEYEMKNLSSCSSDQI